MTALLVDDNPLNLKLLRVLFQAEGFQTLEASDGIEALTRLNEQTVEVIVTDILMPNMDGYRLCRAIRQDPKTAGVALVVYTSTYVSAADKDLALNCGADIYLRKPSPAKELMQAVSEARVLRSNLPKQKVEPLEADFLRSYNQSLIHKLEERNLVLEDRTRLLGESEQKFRILIENLQAVFFLTGPQGKPIHYISPSYEDLWHRSCASLYENPDSWLEAVDENGRVLLKHGLADSPQGFALEFQLERGASERRWIRMRATQAVDSTGRVIGLCGLAEDISPLKVAEFQFQQAQKMEGIGRLAAGVAHDFNNILTAIYGFNSLVSRKIEPDHPAVKDVLMIEKLVGRAAKLTHQLLAFSRKQIIEPRNIDLEEILDDLEKLLGPILGEDIEFSIEKNSGPFHVRVDPGQMEQVLMNLCVNARDAMPTGGKLVIRLGTMDLQSPEPASMPEPWVTLAVEDSGVGMDRETMSHIFEPFFTTKEIGKGTGLGLATCFGIVSQSGGRLQAESTVGNGSVFTIFLPQTQEALSHSLEPTSTPPSGHQSGTLLIVDDDRDVAEATIQGLRDEGFLVLLAHSGAEALAQVDDDTKQRIRLVVTDVVMPGQSGKDLASKIGQLRPDILILYTSGYTDDSVVRRGIAVQGLNFLRKPFTPTELSSKIRQILGGNNGSKPSPETPRRNGWSALDS